MQVDIPKLVHATATKLKYCDSPNPVREVRLMLAELLNETYEHIFMMREEEVPQNVLSQLEDWVERRSTGEPLAKILHKKGFWQHTFKTTADTLDPRPESECIIEQALEHAPVSDKELRILDLGTGTGCLLISLLHEYPNAAGIGVDVSYKACCVANENLNQLGFAQRGLIVNSSWLEVISGKFDIIISNPPYIAKHEKVSEAAEFDPSLALYADNNGLVNYEYFAKKASNFLQIDGILIIEYGHQQHERVVKLFETHGYNLIGYAFDINKIKRASSFRFVG